MNYQKGDVIRSVYVDPIQTLRHPSGIRYLVVDVPSEEDETYTLLQLQRQVKDTPGSEWAFGINAPEVESLEHFVKTAHIDLKGREPIVEVGTELLEVIPELAQFYKI